MQQGSDVIKLIQKNPNPQEEVICQVKRFSLTGQISLGVVFFRLTNPSGQPLTPFTQRFFAAFSQNSHLSSAIIFENALKQLNFAINELRKNKIEIASGAAALIKGKEVQFSLAGNGRALLYRQNNLKQLSDYKGQGEVFESITSGQLEKHEWLTLCPNETLNLLSGLDDRWWSHSSMHQLADELRSMEKTDIPLQGVMIRLTEIDRHNEEAVFGYEGNPRYNFDESASTTAFPQAKKIGRFFSQVLWWIVQKTNKLQNIQRPQIKLFHRSANLIVFALIIVLIASLAITASKSTSNQTKKESKRDLVGEIKQFDLNNRADYILNSLKIEDFEGLSDAEKDEIKRLSQLSGVELIYQQNPLFELDQPVTDSTTFKNLVYFLDNQGQLWQDKDNKIEKVNQTQNISQPLSVAIVSDKAYVISSTQGNIWMFGSNNPLPKTLPLPSNLAEGGKKLATFANNLYLYNPVNLTVFRVSNFSEDLSKRTVYQKINELKIPDITDWTINNQFYSLDSSGRLYQWRSDKIISQIDTGISANKIAVNPSTNKVAVGRNNHLIIYDGSLTPLKQIKLLVKDGDTMNDLVFSKENELLVSIKNKVYSVTL